ncbi:hypothetical protein J2853_004505 [Streptosporangium lutulentum]|uniref:Uncharacterized protein n=1 Tax=Streptosporangium lutulentum TaxID=1461250 RepID=A0ABT9QF30_9ACTN|nr:hypothetical protein [Streptosporangium lutulentum]
MYGFGCVSPLQQERGVYVTRQAQHQSHPYLASHSGPPRIRVGRLRRTGRRGREKPGSPAGPGQETSCGYLTQVKIAVPGR